MLGDNLNPNIIGIVVALQFPQPNSLSIEFHNPIKSP
jgi:hypothetical protein